MEPFIGVFRDENCLSDGFVAAKRVDYLKYDNDSLITIVKEHCIDKNQPIVISNMNKSDDWNSQIFTLNRLKELCGDLELAPLHTNNVKKTDILGDYIQTLQDLYNLNSSEQLETENTERKDQHSPVETISNIKIEDLEVQSKHALNEKRSVLRSSVNTIKPTNKYKRLTYSIEKIYAKDISCPTEYKEALKKIIPEYLHSQGNNDLFSLLPPRFKAENFMCYLAQNKTGTPMHRDICATVGHNIMTMASSDGYAEWFIVVHEDSDKLASIMRPVNPFDKKHIEDARPNKSATKSSFMESERAWLRKSHMKSSNFTVQVILQRVGDLVIIPSRAYHQVRNIGVSVKVAWNRVTAKTLANTFEDQLPLYQIVCRPEVFKCKAIVYYTLQEWSNQLKQFIEFRVQNVNNLQVMKYGRDHFINDSIMLLDLYLKEVLYPEILSDQDEKGVIVDVPDEFCTVKCDFCHADVFYHYFECKECNDYDLCMKCYAAGRSCPHASKMKMRRSDADLPSIIGVYKDFIINANIIFEGQIFTDKSKYLHPSLLQNFPNLATICRRLERYRNASKEKLNIFTCTHCLQEWNVAELAECGISFTSIFQRSICRRNITGVVVEGLDVFVCEECTSKCNLCQPLKRSNDAMKDVSLVYYAPPAIDQRNMGAYFDVGVQKSFDCPTVLSIEKKKKYIEIITQQSEEEDSISFNKRFDYKISDDEYIEENTNESENKNTKKRVEVQRANQTANKKIRTTRTEDKPVSSTESELELRVMVEACRSNKVKQYVKKTFPRKHRSILPSMTNNSTTPQDQAGSPADQTCTQRTPGAFLPFPKSAYELYMEEFNKKDKEKSVEERLLEAAQKLVKKPAEKVNFSIDFR